MKLLKKTNLDEAQAFLRSQLKMYMTVFFHFYSESNPKQIAKSVVFCNEYPKWDQSHWFISFEWEDIVVSLTFSHTM